VESVSNIFHSFFFSSLDNKDFLFFVLLEVVAVDDIDICYDYDYDICFPEKLGSIFTPMQI